jgi:hypothetical protein
LGGAENDDQITNFQLFRWISAGEASWIMLGFHRYELDPSVSVLHVHLPGEDQLIVSADTGEIESAVSKLLLYFARPSSLTAIKFHEYFEMFVVPYVSRRSLDEFDRSQCTGTATSASHVNAYGMRVKRRVKGRVLARLEYIPISVGETYFLRLCLRSHAAMSFEDVRTVGGVVYPTFRDAASAHGLFNEEEESDHLWEHAVQGHLSARGLRALFVSLAGTGGDAQRYLEEYWNRMSFDLPGESEPEYYQYLLLDLKERFESVGRSLSDFGLPEPDVSLFMRPGLGDNSSETVEYERLMSMLDIDQINLVEAVQESIQLYESDRRPHLIFVQACAGSGKTLVARVISHMCRGQGIPVFNSASCGLQARNLDGGKTNHSMYGIPVSDATHVTSNFDISSSSVENFLGGVHILDEAQNQHSKNLEAIEALLTDIAVHTPLQDGRKFAGAAAVIMFADMQQVIFCTSNCQ